MRPSPNTLIRGAALALLVLAAATAPAHAKPMDVEVWTDRGEDAVYKEGDEIKIKVRAGGDAYMLVYELDTEGRVNLLYPLRRGPNHVEAHEALTLPDPESGYQLVVEPSTKTGQAFIVAVASETPFRDLPWYLRPFDPQAASVGYEDDPEARAKDEEGFDEQGRIVGDPYVAMERIRRRVLVDPANVEGFGTAYTTYYVHEQVRYPRYVCNDCHRPAYWSWWPDFDPYYTRCSVVDFRVNWSWYWGPQIWTSCVPYYYYVVRTDCPPRYASWAASHQRFSSWNGWSTFNSLWGGELRRFKPVTAPASYVPPPARGTIWRDGSTPPGFVPPDVRRVGSSADPRPVTWMPRDRGDGKPVWRQDPRPNPGSGDAPRWRPVGGGSPASTPPGGSGGGRQPIWRGGDHPRGGSTPAPPSPPSGGSQGDDSRQRGGDQPVWRGGNDSPRERPHQDTPPRQEPQRQDPPRGEPGYKQPPPQSAPPRWSPPPPKQDGRPGQDGKSKGGGQ